MADKYLLVRDGDVEHLLGLGVGGSRAIATSASRADLLAALVRDAGLTLLEFAVPGAAAPDAAPARATRQRGSSVGGVCGWCHQQRIKDGVTSTGAQRWRCPVPHNAKTDNPSPRTRRRAAGAPRRGTTKALFAKNPACPGGHGPMNIRGRSKGVTYYICKKGCPKPPDGKGWSSVNLPTPMDSRRSDGGTELESLVRARVSKLNGHSAQVRDDIVQEILLDLEMDAVSLHDVQTNDEVVRRYIRKVQSGEPNKFRDVSIDAPPRDGETPLVEKLVR